MALEIEIDITEVERLASLGMTKEQISLALGISERTFYKRQSECADFAAAVKKGQAKGIQAVANKLFDNAMGGNVTAQLFYLKARARWTDQPDKILHDDDQAVSGVEVLIKDASAPDS